MRNSIIEVKKYSKSLQKLVATAHMQEHGVTCYFNSASEAINFGATRSDILDALKKDISKTAEDLFKGQEIINSIEKGRVVEFNSIYNRTEDVFGLAYSKEDQTIKLSEVIFDLSNKSQRTKAQMVVEIFRNVFNIDAKELSSTLKSVKSYESATSEINKVISLPSVAKADEMIKKITETDIAYASYKDGMDFEQKTAHDITFKRTGITGVIQNSTYFDHTGVKQIASSHKVIDTKELEFIFTSGRLKYFDALEVDGDGDLNKALRVLQQVEKLKLNTSEKITFKFRKLGNLNARGVCIANQRVVAEDVRDTSAVLHEIAHHIHLLTLSEHPLVIQMVNKLDSLINLNKVPEFAIDEIAKKSDYYHTETEVVARALEIATLLAVENGLVQVEDDDFMLIKSRSFYEEYQGIYFCFNSFSNETVGEMLALFELFFNTAHGSTVSSKINNFIKIDTNYKRVEKEPDFLEILKAEKLRATRERRALFSMVRPENIELIVNNRGNVGICHLATTIMSNIDYCGDHNERMSATAWAVEIEAKAKVIKYLVETLQKELNNKELVMYLSDVKRNLWSSVTSVVLMRGFRGTFVIKLKREIELLEDTTGYEFVKEFNSTVFQKHPIVLANKETLKEKELIIEMLAKRPLCIDYIDGSLVDIDLLKEYNYSIKDSSASFFINKSLRGNIDFMKDALVINLHSIMYASEELKNNADFMKYAIATGVDFSYLGDELKDNVEFVSAYVANDPQLVDQISQRLQKDPSILGLFDVEQKEIESLEGAKTSYRRKVARDTTSKKVLEFLAKDRNMEIRAEVAKRETCPVAILESLSKLKSEWVQGAIAGNMNTPRKILYKMLKDDTDSWILEKLASNASLQIPQLTHLSLNTNRNIQWAVLCNKKIQNAIIAEDARADIVQNCMKDNEEHFHYMFKTSSDFNPSFRFLKHFSDNTEEYLSDKSYTEAFQTLTREIIEHQFKDELAATQVVSTSSIKELCEEKNSAGDLSDFETLVESDNTSGYKKLIANGEISDYTRTDNGEEVKVLRIQESIDDFKSFKKFMSTNKIGFYSNKRYANGWILYPEYVATLNLDVKDESISSEVIDSTMKAASVVVAAYSADMLQTFANGTLF